MRIRIINAFAKDYELSKLFIGREIAARYKGSQLGLTWTIVNPLIMLSVYTLVFSQIFQSRWSEGNDPTKPMDFALNLFAGLVIFNIFGESITRAPTLITSNPNFVKKIRFPLHVLGEMIVGNSLFHAAVSFGILLTAKLITENTIHLTVLVMPLVLLPYVLICLGLVWLLATIGVFIKDISQVITAIVSMLMFLSPIFYPASALPKGLYWMVALNPIAQTIDMTRQCVINGILPDINQLLIQTIIAIAWCEVSYRTLKKVEKSFGDVL